MSEFILIPQKKFDDLNQKVDLLIDIISKSSGQTVKMNDWISQQEAEKLLGLKETSMWTLRKTRKIAFSKIGAKTFYSLKSIERLLGKNQE
jgi:hypothetical protein